MDALEHIQTQLDNFGGRQKMNGAWRQIQCPFHSDNTPSGGVVVSREHTKYKLGFYHCFSCGASLPWNEFAEKAGLAKIEGFDSGGERITVGHVSQQVEESLLGQDTFTLKGVLKRMGCPEAIPWLEDIEWRGYKGKFLKRIGALLISDDFNGDIGAAFPVIVNGKVRGGVKAVMQRKERQIAYITMKGDWVANYGLFGHDYAKELMKRKGYNFIILVEGPRDCLRLLRAGLPAVAILGANNFADKKARTIMLLGVNTIWVIPDNDSGGKAMWKKVKSQFEKYDANLKRIKLPTELDKHGALIKVDPGNMDKSLLREIKELVTGTQK